MDSYIEERNYIEECNVELLQDFTEIEKECYALLNFLAQAKEAIPHIHTEDDVRVFNRTFYHLEDEMNLKRIRVFNRI